MEELKRLKESIKDANNNKKVLKKWVVEEKARMVYNSDIAYVRSEGRKEGIEEGIELKELELVKKMLLRGDSYESISEITDKTIEEIKEIENNITEE